MIGEAIPYNIGNDSIVQLLYVLNLLGTAYVFILNGRNIVERIKSMFYYRTTSQPFESRTNVDDICSIILYAKFIFYCTIISLKYQLYTRSDITSGEAHLIMLSTALCLLLFLPIKRIAYDMVNHTLFNGETARQWRVSYFFTFKIISFALFPLITAVVIYFATPTKFYYAYLAIVAILWLSMLYLRAFSIIFGEKRKIFNIFLYLCAIELLPIGFLWKAVLKMNDLIIINF